MAAVAANPAEVLVHNDARQTALEVLRLAFPFARAQVDLLPPAPVPPPSAPSGGIDPQTLARLAAEAAARLKQAQAGIERIQRELAPAPPGRRATLQRQLAEARAELQLAKARQGTMDAFTSFTARQGVGAGLLEQIDGLERSVPELQANAGKTALPAERAAAGRSQDGGVLALSGDLLSLVRKRREVQDERRSTDALRDAAGRLSAPLVADLRTASQEGDRLTLAERSNNLTVLGERTRRIEEVTSHFKKVSDALVPLAKQSVLLDAFEGHLSAWDKLIDRQLGSDLRGLLLRFALVALGIAAVLAASEVWRRATFRYVHDARRRRQFLLLRRIVVTGAVVLFIAFSFATELGSLATFAGFITAGLAIALQNVILSVVAYFFLIGKYGVRVRDRVQISGVTGDVIDVGLVRMHLMEIGPDGQPTGRVVVFSNAVLFQPTANFFKQLPGSNFTWHTVTLTFSPESDYRLAESRLLSSVEAVYEKYRASIEAQHQRVSEDLFVQLAALKPQSHLRLTAAGLEMIIRFPVPLDKASSIDDEVTRALLDAIEREPKLKLAGSAIPTISAAGNQSAAAH
jgi:small-conductance mechanosensitive channel